MKKNILKPLIGLIAIVLLYSCEKTEPDTELNLASEVLGSSNENTLPKSREIAHIQKNGLDVKFYRIGNEEEADYEIFELSKLYDYDLLKNEGWIKEIENKNPFELFILLTSNQIAIPEAIASTVDYETLKTSGRSIASSFEKTEILDPNYAEILEKSSNCYNEAESYFRSERCQTPLSSNSSHIEFCDSGYWTSHSRSSYFGGQWRETLWAHTWTNVICGQTTVKFFRYRNNSWELRKEVVLDGGIWSSNYYSYRTIDNDCWFLGFCPGKRVGTRKRVERTQSSIGSFRAYTLFSGQP